MDLDALIDETQFCGVVRVRRAGAVEVERVSGFADWAHRVPNTIDTQFGAASITKSFTAVAVMALVVDGLLGLDTRVRELLHYDALALVDPAVTIGHLLAHTSGIGDYLDESLSEDHDGYVMPVPVHTLAAPADYLQVLGGHPQKFAPGARLEYCNGAYVMLALAIEAATGRGYHDVVAERVFMPASMHSSAFLRSDQLPGSAAIGYITAEGDPAWRTNVLHLPVRGVGDGGAYTTVDDIDAFWRALFDGSILPRDVVDEMLTPQAPTPDGEVRSRLGLALLADATIVTLEGADAGISSWSAHAPASQDTYTVLSNTSDGAWPLVKAIEAQLEG